MQKKKKKPRKVNGKLWPTQRREKSIKAVPEVAQTLELLDKEIT